MTYKYLGISLVLVVAVAAIGAFPAGDTPTGDNTAQRLSVGEKYYSNICASCHGDDGKGDGPTAAYLKVKPRDFTRAQFKFRSTASGQLPLDEDLYRTITGGLPGTAMPPFGEMSPEVISDIVLYIKTLSPRFKDPKEYPLDTVKVGTPIAYTTESVRRGRQVFVKAKCWECHGIQGKGDGPSVDNQFDDKGNKLFTPDLTHSWDRKVGFTPELVYKIFTTGLNGTTMPSYKDVLNDQERWDLANYVMALGDKRKPFDDKVLDKDEE
jgi:cytochrome c oxidase cbb3-type subunit 2